MAVNIGRELLVPGGPLEPALGDWHNGAFGVALSNN